MYVEGEKAAQGIWLINTKEDYWIIHIISILLLNSVSSDRNQKQSSNNEKDFMFIVSHTWTEYD